MKLIAHDGTTFDPTNPHTLDYSPHYISRALSRIHRWQGNSTMPISVARHSLIVSHIVPPWLRLPALLHDAHEAYTGFGDVAAPMKPADLIFLEMNIDIHIADVYGFDFRLFNHPKLRRADIAARAAELRQLFPRTPHTKRLAAELDPAHSYTCPIPNHDHERDRLDMLTSLQQYVPTTPSVPADATTTPDH